MQMTGNRRRPMAQALCAMTLGMSMVTPLVAGCGNNTASQNTGRVASNSQPGYGTVPAPRNAPAQQNRGLSTGQKVAILAGAAALYYMYNRNKNNKGTGPNGQYYRSKNGRIYYRDAKGNAVYVTPPANGIQVPADVAERYNRAAQSGNFGMVEGDSFPASQGGDFGYSTGNPSYNGNAAPSGPAGSRMPAGAGSGYGGGSAMPPGPRGF